METYNEFAEIYDDAMEEIPYHTWCEDIVDYLKEQGIETGTICELGCGTGTMAELLAAKGYQVTGVDVSDRMLQKAMEKREVSGADIQYVMQDMRELTLHQPVDVMLSVCDSMNYLLELSDLEQVFQKVHEYLKPNGIFIFDLKTAYCYREVMGDTVMTEHTEDATYIWENTFFEEERINEYALTIFTKEPGTELFRRYEEVHEQRAYDIEEIKMALFEAGLSLQHIYGSKLGEEATREQERIYFIAKGRNE